MTSKTRTFDGLILLEQDLKIVQNLSLTLSLPALAPVQGEKEESRVSFRPFINWSWNEENINQCSFKCFLYLETPISRDERRSHLDVDGGGDVVVGVPLLRDGDAVLLELVLGLQVAADLSREGER